MVKVSIQCGGISAAPSSDNLLAIAELHEVGGTYCKQ